MALAVPTHLWLVGVIGPRRDRALITALVQKVRACARSLAYPWSAWMAWRATSPPFCGCSVTRCVRGVADGRGVGSAHHTSCAGMHIQRPTVIKRYARRRVVTVVLPCGVGDHHSYCQGAQRHRRRNRDQHRLYRGLNATFMSALAPLARRGRPPQQKLQPLMALAA
jgi:hypothetical protein